MKKTYYLSIAMTLALITYSCSDEFQEAFTPTTPLSLTGQISQENITRANDYGFVGGDRMGIYVVDRENGEPGTLGAADNRGINVLYTYNADSYKWASPTTIYWRDQQTPVDIYGYYPGVNYISDPTDYRFEVQTDQSTKAQNGELSGYEQSDLLWGKAANVSYTQEQILVQFHHILAGVRVQLQKGGGISDTEWEKLEKIVLINNTVTKSSINLSNSNVALSGDATNIIRMLPQSDDSYRAVVIPQTVAADKQLLSITLDGQTYDYSRETAMEYQSGKLHNFTMTINKREASGDYEISVTDDGIIPWINDEASHQFSAMSYVTVHCSEYGTLKQCLTNAGYDYKTIQNLKVTGEISELDFDLLRDQMPELHHLNLKEVTLKHICYYDSWWDTGNHDGNLYRDDMIPDKAFYGNQTIRSLVLPSSIKRLGGNCFREMRLMYSTLEIPEGVTCINENAFSYNDYNGVELILPNTLDSIYNRAFAHCHYKCELKLTDNIKYIGEGAFDGWQDARLDNFYGVFHLPIHLKELPSSGFCGLGIDGSFTGDIEIPQGITEIPDELFSNGVESMGRAFKNRPHLFIPEGVKEIGRVAFSGIRFSSIHLNNDLETIGANAFEYCSMPFPITLPNGLKFVNDCAFRGCGIEGELVIPEQCLYLAENCFQGNEFTSIQLPSRLENINKGCFANNGFLTSITLPKYVSYIGEYAFSGCDALQTVICLNPEPPDLESSAFDGVYFDKCILQVPEASVETYRHTNGWNQFKNITAYHELAFNLPEILALDKGQTATGVIRAEGAWQVSECPDWVTVSPSSGSANERKVELTITVKPMTTEGERSGRIVFSLDGKNYTTYTEVRQICNADIKEDQKVVLQTASAGASRAVPIFIVGEGYSAADIVSGQYMDDMQQQIDYLFSCEPYKTYKNYFTVSTAIAVSPESGINGRIRFQPENWWVSKDELIWNYAKAHGEGITDERADETTIIVLQNTNSTGGNTSVLSDNGRTISYLGKSTDTYPFSQREFVLREVGGIAFGHLGNEGISHFTFLKSCTCPGCQGLDSYKRAKQLGWYDNISISGKMNEVPWRDLIFDERYAQSVDIYEGAYNHARGVYRSENMSIMGNTFIPYYNTISRMSIVKRIMKYSGETFSLDSFFAKDKMEIPE